jgi:hypothetical protein
MACFSTRAAPHSVSRLRQIGAVFA